MNLSHNFRSDTALARYSDCRHLWDTPLFETDSFVALPTVGAFIEGWLLVVPRVHVLSYAQINDDLWDEAENFLRETARSVESKYGPVAIFEHGPSRKQSALGCGVDYAHFHIVPTMSNLRDSAIQAFPNVTWKSCPSVRNLRDYRDCNNGYWALWQKQYSSDFWVGTALGDVLPNQLFRRVLSKSIGLEESSFDWKKDLGQNLIAATVEKLTCAVTAHE